MWGGKDARPGGAGNMPVKRTVSEEGLAMSCDTFDKPYIELSNMSKMLKGTFFLELEHCDCIQ